MNERIEKLAVETEAYCDQHYHKQDLNHLEYNILWQQKFAQLIVRDICQMIESQDVDPAFKHRMSWAVKDRYGVE